MELPHLGEHCTEKSCKKLDFLPIRCDACNNLFCDEHYHYSTHNCPNAYKKDKQVPVCPLCDKPIPVSYGEHPDVIVGRHIDSDCQSDTAKDRRKVFTNKCSLKGCKKKEVIPVVCTECTLNYCLKHRHPVDHKCEGKIAARRKLTRDAAVARQKNIPQSNNNPSLNSIQGNMSEDEALARALALSMQETSNKTPKQTQEELDMALARQLQASESQTAVGGTRNNRDRCNVC